jgi:hypothetical protein
MKEGIKNIVIYDKSVSKYADKLLIKLSEWRNNLNR